MNFSSLPWTRFACYAYVMDVYHPANHSPRTSRNAAQTSGDRFLAKSLFDGTKLPLVVGHSQSHK
jgi:hypothetical protein